MDYRYKKENYDFWVQRLKENNLNQVCTNDVALDDLESQQILKKMTNNKSVLEIGCGNGLLYNDLKQKFNLSKYIGTDFVKELITDCNLKKFDNNDDFLQLDMTEVDINTFETKFDYIISKRAIQNVIDHKLQIEAIDNFGFFLEDNGLMILVESSNDAQNNINIERNKYELGKINAPFHNLFFDDNLIRNHNFKNIKLLNIDPFSSDFYYITRIIYARYAKEYLNEEPNFNHPLQRIALTMAGDLITKDFSQIKCYTFVKK